MSELLRPAEKDKKEKLANANNSAEITPAVQVNDRKYTSVSHRHEY